MRAVAAVIAAAMTAVFLLCGCESLTFNVSDLLTAPSIADEQAEVYNALISSVGRPISLCYPRSGDYPSAFVLFDIDGDGLEEAICFYTYSQAVEPVVMLSVLDKPDGESWQSVCTLEGRGEAVDKVMLADYGGIIDIIIGYETPSYDENNVSIYRCSQTGVLSSIFDGAYALMDCVDLDGCGTKEIVMLKKEGSTASVRVIKTGNGVSYDIKERTLSLSTQSIVGFCFGGMTEDTDAVFVDILDTSGVMYTHVFYMMKGEILSPTLDTTGMYQLTSRYTALRSVDYDSDGIVEIPVSTPFLGYYSVPSSRTEYMTSWMHYDSGIGVFIIESATYYSEDMGVVFRIPGRWQNLVTVLHDDDPGQVTFCQYDIEAGSVDDMPRLMTLAAVPADESESYIESGYSYVKGDGVMAFLSKNLAPEGEPMLLTQDEISDNIFHVIP